MKNSTLYFLKSLKGFYILILFVLSATHAFAQLDDLHYLPPLKQNNYSLDANRGIRTHKIYISTPETSAFNVNVYRGTSNTVYATFSVSKSAPVTWSLSGGTNGDNGITLIPCSAAGIVQSNAGLRFESAGGKKFYVNYRGVSGNQGSLLVSKGRAALGKNFKWGGVPNTITAAPNSVLGIMATEDGTTVEIFGYDPNCVFTLNCNISGITANSITINLNKGQSYVLEAVPTNTASINTTGWLGASIASNKDIAVSIGEINFQTWSGSGGIDVGIDQIIPENRLGKEYAFVRGRGPDGMETPVIIATANNTQIYVNGNTTPVATINNGDYYVIPATNYSNTSVGANMYVNCSHEVYAFQALAGSSSIATGDINFIAPLNCLLSNTIDNISSVTDLAGKGITNNITIVASSNIPSDSIIVKYGIAGTTVLSASTIAAARKVVAGTSDWVTYYLTGLSGNVSVSTTGPIAVGFFGYNVNVGASGYFSGFETIPNITVQTSGNGCLPSSVLTATAGYSSYSWFNSGVLIPGETNNTFTPTLPGSYSVVVQVGTCTYESAPVTVVNCNPDIQLSNTANVSSGKVNDIITFTIKAKYIGNGTVTNLVVNNLIPSGLTYQSYSATYGTLSAGTATNKDWTIGTMYSGEEHILTVTTKVATVVAANAVTYTVSNTQTQTDGNTLPDDSTESILLYKNTLPVLSNFGAINKHRLDAPFTLIAPTSTSPGSFTYSSSNTAVATVSGSTVTIVGAGTAVITANQAASGSYDIGFITATLKVNAIEEVLTNFGKKTTENTNSNAFISTSGSTLAQKVIAFGGKLVEVKSPTISAGSSLVVWVDSEFKSSYNQVENTWYDLSGNYNNGALQNNFNYSTSNAKSFVFNGTNNDINFLKAHPASDSVTIETWMNAAAFSSGAIQTLFSHTIAGAGSLRLEFDNNKLRANLSNANCFYDCPMTFTADKWYHIAVVYSKTGNAIQFYVNGALIHTATVSSGPTVLSSTFKLGSFNGNANYFNGKMGSFKMYTSARTAAEIVADFTSDKKRYGNLVTTTASTSTSNITCPDGLTAAKAGTSAYQIKQDYPSSTDGLYWIANSNINSGTPFQIYADMTTDGGGWTLIMTNTAASGWTYANAIALNTGTPSINSNYSIIGWADYIKRSASGFQYMIDAFTRGSYGGIWTANGSYSFVNSNNTQTNVTRNIKFGTWDATNSSDDDSIEERMPWYSNCVGTITTSTSCSSAFWGTLITTGNWSPAPYINADCGTDGCMPNPGFIWYWVR